jgi:hypothetical protein
MPRRKRPRASQPFRLELKRIPGTKQVRMIIINRSGKRTSLRLSHADFKACAENIIDVMTSFTAERHAPPIVVDPATHNN